MTEEKEYVFVLTEYEYCTGIEENEIYVHKTYIGAAAHATKRGLKVVEYPEESDEATIEKMELLD